MASQGMMASSLALFSDVGKSAIPATGLTGEARQYFDQGVALTYGFNHKAAIRSFRAAADRAPDCAMCLWGIALANGPNINAGMDSQANRDALAALERAEALAEGLSPLEQGLIAAQKLRYSSDPGAERSALDAAYADAMMALAKANPANDDIQILAAEAAMNTTPWNYWTPVDKAPQPRIGEAVELIETVIARNPQHPQASHLYIHLMEDGPDPRRAEAVADELTRSAPPALGHLVHMPAHIFYRLGRYTDSVEANILAARADEAYIAQAGDDGLYRFGYYPHNVHFLIASAQMTGNMHAVFSETARLEQIIDVEIAKELAWVQAIHAAPSFALAQYASPAATLALTKEASPLGYVEAMRHYARAIAFAQSGDEAGYRGAIAALDAQATAPEVVAMQQQGFPAPLLVELASHVAKGRHAMAHDDPAVALKHFTKAEELEAGVPYTEPPYWYYPVAQSRGAALYQLGRYEEASKAFGKALFKAPNNGWALYGLSKSEAKAGRRTEAAAAKAKLDEIWQGKPGWLSMKRL